jgi:DNA-binding IclR family transcriptional regulator
MTDTHRGTRTAAPDSLPAASARPASPEVTGRQPKAVSSALDVLEEVAHHAPGVTAKEISRALRLSAPTTYRLLNLLVADEYLVRLPDLRGFALGRRAIEFAGFAAAPWPVVPRRAHAVVARVRGLTRWGIHLVGYRGGQLYLLDPDPDHPPHDEIHLRCHADDFAVGMLMRLHAAGEAPVDHATRVGGADPVTGCVALAIRDENGMLAAALAATGPVARFPDALPDTLAMLRPAAEELSDLLT